MDPEARIGMESEFYFSPLMILDEDENILLEVTTQNDLEWKTQDLDLTLMVLELKEPFNINLPTNKSVNVTISVYDNDGAFSSDDFTRDMTNMVPFSSKQVGEEWSEIVLDSPDKEANLTLRYRILESDEHFTGHGCNLCTERWTGEQCDSCAYGYYPKGSCSTYCDPVEDDYTCDLTSGEKICAERKTGANCDRCAIYHFGEECLTFCKATEYYTCSEGGKKICLDDNACPEKDCKKNNTVMITGIVVGSVLLVSLLGNIILVYRLRRNANQKNLNKQQDNTLINPLQVVVDPAVAGRKEGPSNDQGGKKNESRIRFGSIDESEDAEATYSNMDEDKAMLCARKNKDADTIYND